MKPVLEVSQLHRPGEAAEVKHVIEYQGGRRSFRRRPFGRGGEAVPETGGEQRGEDGHDEDIAQLLRPRADGPAKAADKRQNTSVKQNVQLEKKGERFAT